jgi:hypothetical protein
MVETDDAQPVFAGLALGQQMLLRVEVEAVLGRGRIGVAHGAGFSDVAFATGIGLAEEQTATFVRVGGLAVAEDAVELIAADA